MPTLRTDDLTKSYGGRTVVRGVSLDVSSGEVVGLLGPNGAGKTTTFYMTVGLTSPDRGRVILDDHDVTDDAMYVRARKGIGYLPQEPSIFRGLTVEQNIVAILETLNLTAAERRERARDLLAELNLSSLASAPAYTLSGGERRRAEITRALVMSPRFILLDEPFAGIDPIAVTDIQKIIFHLKARGIGVLVTDHNVRETLRITDRAYIVNDGVIFRNGTPRSASRRRGCAADLSGDRLPSGLRWSWHGSCAATIDERFVDGNGDPAEAANPTGAEADPDAIAAASHQASADVDSGTRGLAEPGGRGKPSARRGSDRGSPGRRTADAGKRRSARPTENRHVGRPGLRVLLRRVPR